MKIFVVFMSILLVSGCFTDTNKKDETNKSADPCQNVQNIFNTISEFKQSDSIQPANAFLKIIQFLEAKGQVEIQTYDSLKTKIFHNQHVTLKHEIYCGDRYVLQSFVLENVSGNVCNFKSTIPITDTSVCRPPCYPAFSIQQCNFASNTDRDSALKIIRWVHNNRTVDPTFNTRMDFKNEYVQVVIDDNTIYLIELNGFKPYEATAIKYAGYLRQYLKENHLD